MRSFLGWVTLLLILGAIAFAAAPFVARPLVVTGVRAALPFPADQLEIDASVETLGLLRGTIDRIHITGSDVVSSGSTIARLDVTLARVSIGDQSFESIEGDLDGVVLGRPDGTRIGLDRVSLAGPSSEVRAEALLGREATIELARAALSGAGLPIDGIELVDGGLRITVLGQLTVVAIGVVDASITIAGSIAGVSIALFGPAAGDPWRITGVSTGLGGLVVHAVVDLDAAIRPR